MTYIFLLWAVGLVVTATLTMGRYEPLQPFWLAVVCSVLWFVFLPIAFFMSLYFLVCKIRDNYFNV